MTRQIHNNWMAASRTMPRYSTASSVRSGFASGAGRLLIARTGVVILALATLAARSPEREKCASNDECGKQGEQRKFDPRPRKWPQWLGSVEAQILDAHGYEADGWATHRLWQWAQM